jgi:nickel-dependent lactate racemase
MKLSLPYGKTQLEIDLTPDVQVAAPKRQTSNPVAMALAAPIGSPRLNEIVRPGQSIAIITSDITRPCPTEVILPAVVDELTKAGVENNDICVVFALGAHRGHTPEEQARLLGPQMANQLHCMDSNTGPMVKVGTTSRGTPIEACRQVVAADFRIALGNIEPHYFAGYSGGAKALVPGVCSKATIQRNHAMMVEPNARTGLLEDNPVRQDLEEGAALIGLDFILNVIVDNQHNIMAAAAGHPIQAHRWACRVFDFNSQICFDQPADLVIVGAGGYPKDINLYQAQKALENAAAVVRPGGTILWLAECPEGLGNATFQEWMVDTPPDEILARIQRDFVLGGHKAAAIARVLKHARVNLVSTLSPDVVRACGLWPYGDLQQAFQEALRGLGPDPMVVVLPEGGAVIPVVPAS